MTGADILFVIVALIANGLAVLAWIGSVILLIWLVLFVISAAADAWR